MNLEEAIVAEVKADATIAAKLSAGGSKYHIYPLRVPEGVTPTQAITYTELSQTLTYPLVRTSLFQLSCIGDTFAKARDLANDVDRIFNDLSETSLGSLFGVKYVKFEGRSAIYDDNANLYIVPVELRFKF